MMRKQRSRGTKTELKTKSYRSDYIRKKMLQKSFKGNEKGYKALDKLADTVHTGIEVLWRQSCMCDIDLVSADRHRFQAHRLVLATCCDFFYDILTDPEAETGNVIEVPEVRGDVLDLLLEAMYTGRVKTEAGNVDDLLIAANTLGMYLVIDACEEFLLEHVAKENCLQILATSFKYNLSRLTEASLNIAAKHFIPVAKTTAFRNLPVEHLIPLLKRDDLNVANELEVFHRAKAWLEGDRKCRLQNAADVLATIRLPLLTPAEIVDNVECCTHLMDVHGCQKLVKEALHYHLMPSRQCLLQSPRTVPRKNAEVCLIVVGGAPRLTSDPVNDKVRRYNVRDNTWEDVTSLPEPRHHHAVAVLNGFLYVAGGDVSNDTCEPVNTVHRFDPRDVTWRQVASMQHCRQSFQMCVLNSAIYAVGGRVSNEELLSAVERYDPALDRWQEVASLTSPRRCVAVGCLVGKLYAVGGSSAKAISSRVERYSPAENTWETMRPVNVPRFFGHLHNVTQFLYLLGGAAIDGRGNVMCVDTIERYSHTNNQWSIISRMRTPRSEAGCTLIKEKIYVVGGYNWNRSERTCDVEVFDTETESWTSLPALEKPLTGLAAGSLQLFANFPRKQNDLTNNCSKQKGAKIELPDKVDQEEKVESLSAEVKSLPHVMTKERKSLPTGLKDSNSTDIKVPSNEELTELESKSEMKISPETFKHKVKPMRKESVSKENNNSLMSADKSKSLPKALMSKASEDYQLYNKPSVLEDINEDNESTSASKACSVEGLVRESIGHPDLNNNCVVVAAGTVDDKDSLDFVDLKKHEIDRIEDDSYKTLDGRCTETYSGGFTAQGVPIREGNVKHRLTL